MLISLLLGAAAAASNAPAPSLPPCGSAYAGRIVSGDAADADMAGKPLVMHVRVCDAAETQIPFHVGDDRSRTWFLTRTPEGVRLKHRHRHADGSLDVRTYYGGDSSGPAEPLPGGGWRLSFPADAHSKALFAAQGIPQSAANVWAVEHVPGRLFAYELKRPGRFFRVEFDLTAPVVAPPPPWGDEAQGTR
jgi:hypothetical protein